MQARLDHIFDRLEDDPFADGLTKFYYTRLTPAGMNVYVDDDFEIVYQLVSHDPPNFEAWDIEIHSIDYQGTRLR